MTQTGSRFSSKWNATLCLPRGEYVALLGLPNIQPPTIHSYFRLRITSFYGSRIFKRNSFTYKCVRDCMWVVYKQYNGNSHFFYHPCARHIPPLLLSSGPSEPWLLFCNQRSVLFRFWFRHTVTVLHLFSNDFHRRCWCFKGRAKFSHSKRKSRTLALFFISENLKVEIALVNNNNNRNNCKERSPSPAATNSSTRPC
jgi:hypothetical protein